MLYIEIEDRGELVGPLRNLEADTFIVAAPSLSSKETTVQHTYSPPRQCRKGMHEGHLHT